MTLTTNCPTPAIENPAPEQPPAAAGAPPSDSTGPRPSTLEAARRSAGQVHHVGTHETLASVVRHFDLDPQCCGVLASDGGRFVNLLSRDLTAAQLAKPFARELFFDKPLARLLPFWPVPALELHERTFVADAIQSALSRPPLYRFEPVVVVADDGSRAAVDIYSLLVAQCEVLFSTLRDLERQREATQAAVAEREEMHQRLVAASREAGRAEVATGVLHNVGNVLNSLNASAGVVSRTLQQSKVANLGRAVTLIQEHAQDLGGFLTTDARGKALPGYLQKLAGVLGEEQARLATEMQEMGRSIEHIKQIVQMQQTHAKSSTLLEPVSPVALMEDAVRVNLVSFDRHNVQVVREYGQVAPTRLDRHKVLQILINLVSNAKNALKGNPPGQKRITLKIDRVGGAEKDRVVFRVEDNGAGIEAGNLTRIFSHGFTTRKEGHGFGLHSAANAAGEMGGTLSAASEGPGRGAAFTLSLPAEAGEGAR